jgi:hypothetical protein
MTGSGMLGGRGRMFLFVAGLIGGGGAIIPTCRVVVLVLRGDGAGDRPLGFVLAPLRLEKNG